MGADNFMRLRACTAADPAYPWGLICLLSSGNVRALRHARRHRGSVRGLIEPYTCSHAHW